MKKIIAMMSVAALVLSLCACSGAPKDDSSGDTSHTQKVEELNPEDGKEAASDAETKAENSADKAENDN